MEGKAMGAKWVFFYGIVILQSSSVGDRWLFGGDLHLKLYPMKLYCNTGNKNIPTVFDKIFDIRTHSWFIKQGAKVIICVYILVTLLFFFNTQHSKRNSIVCFYSFKTLLSEKPIYTLYQLNLKILNCELDRLEGWRQKVSGCLREYSI